MILGGSGVATNLIRPTALLYLGPLPFRQEDAVLSQDAFNEVFTDGPWIEDLWRIPLGERHPSMISSLGYSKTSQNLCLHSSTCQPHPFHCDLRILDLHLLFKCKVKIISASPWTKNPRFLKDNSIHKVTKRNGLSNQGYHVSLQKLFQQLSRNSGHRLWCLCPQVFDHVYTVPHALNAQLGKFQTSL